MNGTHRGEPGGRDQRPHVAIAEYHYRHEAEFAAGFLRGAGIPFRLQIDDAGGADAGVTIGRPAVLWVRADDEEEARSILALDGSSAAIARREATSDVTPEEPEYADRGSRPGATRPAPRPRFAVVPLCQSERILAGVLALALCGLAAYGGDGAVPWVSVWESIALALALCLGLSAVSGQTLASIRAILRTLSGFMP